MSIHTDGILPIQRAMAAASPAAWRDGIVVDAEAGRLTLALLDGAVLSLRVQGTATARPGEPAAYHPVAEILAVGGAAATARPTTVRG